MEQPFYIGQRVVVVYGGTPKVPNGSIHTVKGLFLTECGCWMIDIGFRTVGQVYCSIHKSAPAPNTGIRWCGARFFAPITPREVEIDEAIIEQAEEMVSVKETVLEPVLN